MRVFVPLASAPDTFVNNVAVTLESMGHEVRTMGAVPTVEAVTLRDVARAVLQRLSGNSPTGENRLMLKRAKTFKPDVFLSLTRGLHPEILDELGRICPGRRILWWGDTPANTKRWEMLETGWDFIFCKDAAAVSKLRLVGRNAHLMHEAMNPMWHRPIAGQANDAVSVAGNSYAFRQAICIRLLAHGVPVAVYGPQMPAWADPTYRKAHRSKYIVREEKSRVFGESLGCLNTFALSEGNSLNCRAFEIAGAAGLQLIEYRSAIDDCFEPGKEVLPFESFDELLAHIDRAQREPAAMRVIREAGARRALAEHTYRHRLEHMFSML